MTHKFLYFVFPFFLALSTLDVEAVTPSAKERIRPASFVVAVSDYERFSDTLKNSNLPVVVEFYSPRCGPCRRFLPKFEEAAEKYDGEFLFLKVNVDEQPEISQPYDIRLIPTVIVFDNGGKIKNRGVGTQEALSILDGLSQYK